MHACASAVWVRLRAPLSVWCWQYFNPVFAAPPLQGVWSRALGLPIERPKSVTMDAILKQVGVRRTEGNV